MRRRGRAAGFAAAAAICAGLAASAAGTGEAGLESELGELRDVVVATRPLPADRHLLASDLRRSLEVRRVPERFAPAGALQAPEQALGRSLLAPVPAGGYLLGSQLRAPRAGGSSATARRDLGPGRRPVEISVSGAAPLAAGRAPRGPVDVVVTTEPGPGGSGRTYVAAPAVELLGLRPVAGDEGAADVVPGPQTDSWLATLALTRGQALRLIQAESFARAVRLIGR